MTDYPTLTQQAVFIARIGSLSQKVARRIVALPKDKREAGLAIVQRRYAAELRENELDNEHGRKWLDVQLEEIRRQITEIEASIDRGQVKDADGILMPGDDNESAYWELAENRSK